MCSQLSVFKLFLDLLTMLALLCQQILSVYNTQLLYQKYGSPLLMSLKRFSVINFAQCYFSVLQVFNIFRWLPV